MNPQIHDEIAEAIRIEADKLLDSFKTPKPNETWRIKVDGRFIMTSSGKTVWKQLGHAKSALRLHFEDVKYKLRRSDDHTYKDIAAFYEMCYQKFLKDRVEFVKIIS